VADTVTERELRVDVTEAVPPAVAGGTALQLGVSVLWPARVGALSASPTVLTLLAGGTYDRRYFHFQVPGHDGYGAARYLADAGHIVLLIDHLGVGTSTRPPRPDLATRQVVAAATHCAVKALCARLLAGSLDPALPPFSGVDTVGVGHSMGGMLLITSQAQFDTYDRIAVLGYTAMGVHLHLDQGTVAAEDMLKALAAPEGPGRAPLPDYLKGDRLALRRTFHWEDVPEAVLAMDDALLVEVPRVISYESLWHHVVRDDAARVRCPVFIALGERDVSPAPHQEPSYYLQSRDVTLYLLPRSGHCHVFAGTRRLLDDRLLRWVKSTVQKSTFQ
jgi:pimeloyl-ACP methyl ester carboxylesterase